MGKRGFITQPAAIAKDKGDYRPSRHGAMENKPDLDFLRTVPDAPQSLNEVGQWCWNALLSNLVQIEGLIAPVYLITFETLCVAYQVYRQALPEVQKGLTETDPKTGRSVAKPEVKIMMDAIKTFNTIGREYGITPSSMDRLTLKPKDEGENDEFQDLEV